MERERPLLALIGLLATKLLAAHGKLLNCILLHTYILT